MEKRPAVGVAVIVIKNGKVLLGKRKGAHGSGSWAFPGGHLEFNESIEDCAKREVFEETGMSIKNLRFATITNDLFHQSNKHYVTLFVVCDHEDGNPQVKEPDKCEKWDWFYWNEFPKPIFLSLKNLLQQGFSPFCIEDALPPPGKLHEMTAAQVVSLNTSGDSEKGLEDYDHEELMEAAFMFENQLIVLLGDENFISYEVYSDMSHTQLADIIENCTEQICKIENR